MIELSTIDKAMGMSKTLRLTRLPVAERGLKPMRILLEQDYSVLSGAGIEDLRRSKCQSSEYWIFLLFRCGLSVGESKKEMNRSRLSDT